MTSYNLGKSFDKALESKALKYTTSTIFGNIRYLEKVTERLYANKITCGKDIAGLTEEQFLSIIGRTTKKNIERIKSHMKTLTLSFSPPTQIGKLSCSCL